MMNVTGGIIHTGTSLLLQLVANETLPQDGSGSNHSGKHEERPIGHDYPMWKVIIFVAVAVILSAVTVLGNIMVMISFKIDKQLQTISNYFLFSLAVADFAIGLISMPLFTLYTILGYWPLGSHVCDTWLALDYLASNASVLNLLIISFDRYFSVTRPLTYRAKRTTTRAAVMIACAWGISLLLWPPWIYAWPYIEGQRTVPEWSCYIQFIETNHYITFGTAIAAFYVPAAVMIILYWRIWQETEKRQKDLPNLQAGNKRETSRQSNSRYDEALDLDECKRPRSESSTGAGDEVNSTHIAVSYLDRHCPQHRKHRPLSWTWLKMWCVAWWHSGREDEDEEEDEDEPGGPESSRTGPGYDDTLTPVSVETPVPSLPSRCDSSFEIQPASLGRFDQHSAGARTPSSSTADSQVYTILIKLPAPPSSTIRSGKEAQILGRSNGVSMVAEAPSIKMYSADEVISFHPLQELDRTNTTATTATTTSQDIISVASEDTRHSLIRRPSNMLDNRIALSAKTVGTGSRTLQSQCKTGNRATPVSATAPIKKKKKSQEKKADKKAAKTLSAILLAFILTWTPYNILVLVKPLTACTGCIPQELWDFFYYLCYINSTINPVCYALCNATFRRTYVRILKCKWHSRTRTGVNRGY